MKVDFRWNKPVDSITDRFAGKDVQLFMANAAKRLMTPYVPSINGESGASLSGNVRVYTENRGGVVHYISPYARYQYYGKVMVSKRPGVKGSEKIVKQPTTPLKYSKFQHPLATSKWDKAMMAARKDELVRSVQEYVGGRK